MTQWQWDKHEQKLGGQRLYRQDPYGEVMDSSCLIGVRAGTHVIGNVPSEIQEAFRVFIWMDKMVKDLEGAAKQGTRLFDGTWRKEHEITQVVINDCLSTSFSQLERARFLLGKSLGSNYG